MEVVNRWKGSTFNTLHGGPSNSKALQLVNAKNG